MKACNFSEEMRERKSEKARESVSEIVREQESQGGYDRIKTEKGMNGNRLVQHVHVFAASMLSCSRIGLSVGDSASLQSSTTSHCYVRRHIRTSK